MSRLDLLIGCMLTHGLLLLSVAVSVYSLIKCRTTAVPFWLGFLVIGIIGAKTLASFGTMPSERIGAEMFLFLLCLAASAISTLSYVENSRRLRRRPRWFTGLLGGVVAAAIFCASASAGYATGTLGVGFGFWVALMLVLPGLIGVFWPLLSPTSPKS